MIGKLEILTGTASVLCFAAAADAVLGTGGADWLADLCLSDPNAVVPAMPAEMMEKHGGHGSLYLAAGFAFASIGFGGDLIRDHIETRGSNGIAWRHKSTLLSAMLHVASASERIRVSEIERLFFEVMKSRVGKDDIRRVYTHLSQPDAPTLGEILSDVSKDREKAEVLRCATSVWSAIGMDSRESTHVVETIISSLGFKEQDVRQLLDRSASREVGRSWRQRTSAFFRHTLREA